MTVRFLEMKRRCSMKRRTASASTIRSRSFPLVMRSFTVSRCEMLATAWRSLVRPLMRPLTLTRMARVLETRHPELQERISSAIELLSMGGDAAAAGSDQLIQMLARDAQTDMSGVQARTEFTGRSLKPALVCGSVIAGIFALLFVVWPSQTSPRSASTGSGPLFSSSWESSSLKWKWAR